MCQNKILVVGGSNDSIFLINVLQQLGYIVICCDFDQNCVGAERSDIYHKISTFDLQGLVEIVNSYNVQYALTRSSGLASINCYKLNEFIKNKLVSNISVELTNKLLLSEVCAKLSINYPNTELATFKNLKVDILGKVVLKPLLEMVGKQTTYVIDSSESIEHRFKYLEACEANSHIGKAIIQEHVFGQDISLLGFVYRKKYFCYAQFHEVNNFEDGEITHSGFFKCDYIDDNALIVANKIASKINVPLTPLNLGFRCHREQVYLLECNLDFGGEGVLESLSQSTSLEFNRFFDSMRGVLGDDESS